MTITLYTISIALMIALPLVLAIALRRRYSTPWWLFALGMATFVGSQAVHLPLNNWLADLGFLAEGVAPAGTALIQNALLLGFTAGLCEEVARAVGYWFLWRRKEVEGTRWEDGVMLGLGHGGIEAMAFGAVLTAASLSSLWALRDTDLASLNLSSQQLAAVTLQLELLAGSPWLAFAPLLERALALTIHVALSLIVWRTFKRRNPFYLLLAIGLHMGYDALLVYVAQQLENVWLLEGIMLLLTLPALFWIWYSGRRRETRPAPLVPSFGAEFSLFLLNLRKELLQQWRTKRTLVIVAVFAVFGILSPVAARFAPEMLSMIEGAEEFADLIPTPTVADSLGQYIKNITQFGFLIAVLLGMGTVAGEKERGTTAMVLSKPLPRWAFILSKFVAQALLYVLGFAVAAGTAYLYTWFLFEETLAAGPFLFGNLLLLVWLLTYVAVTILGSALARSTGAAAALGLLGAVSLLLAGTLPRIGPLAPAGLVAWAGQLGLATEIAPNGGALATGIVLIVIFLLLAVAAFEEQEL